MGLYPSHPGAPKVVISNGMVIPNYCTREEYARVVCHVTCTN
jgi:urocanate hydratase